MNTYLVLIGGQQAGPYTEADMRALVSAGTIRAYDPCWTQGMSEWAPIHQVIAIAPPAHMQPFGYAPGTMLSYRKKPVGWTTALVFFCVSTPISWILSLTLSEAASSDAVGVMLLLGVPIMITSAILNAVLLYQCWAALPEPYRATTPGKAVGFLFIPIFNLYWMFVCWPKLALGVLEWQKAEWRNNPGNVRPYDGGGSAIALAILALCGSTLGLIPGLGILIGIAHMIVYIIFYKKTVSTINTLLGY